MTALPAAGHHADPISRVSRTTRLTAGWRDADRSAHLREHLLRYGPLPRHWVDGARGTGLASRASGTGLTSRASGTGLASRASGTTRADGPAALIDAVLQAGLTGRGGAGFPTGVKMRTVAAEAARTARYGPAVVVANGMESEPASEKDKALLSRAPHLVLDGIALAATAVGADVAHLCLPRDQRWLIGTVEQAIVEREHAGMDPIAINLHELPHHYVSSEETSLVHWLNGGEAKPTAVPPRPFQRGVQQRPTLLDNVETLAHVALIARFGPKWFREAGLADAPGTMLSTVSGAVDVPGVYEIEVGTPIGDVLRMSRAHADAGSILIGGYFGTWHDVADVAGLPLAAESLRRIGSSPGTGVLFVLPPDACGLTETARVLAWLAGQGAGQCGPCMFGLPAIADDFAQIANGRPTGSVVDRLGRRLGTVEGRGACRHPDGAVRLARSALSAFAADVHAHLSRRMCVSARDGRPRAALPIPRTHEAMAWQ
jgi:NADH:ubiquinone oxidoreductase subunit F (NADH-binding)